MSDHDHPAGAANDGDQDHTKGVASNFTIAGHPLHPILVTFPIASLVGQFASDVGYLKLNDPFWARASYYLAICALASAVVAAVPGLVDFITVPRTREHPDGWIHFLGNFVVILLTVGSIAVRASDPVGRVWPWGFLLSASTVALLLVTAWYGGELVFRHMIGVTGHGPEDGQATAPPPTLDAAFLRSHSERDHHLFGWTAVPIAFVWIVHTFTDAADPVWRWWPIPWMVVSAYFIGHIEPDTKLLYPTWLSSWKDAATRVHRIINIGGVVASIVELGIIHRGWTVPGLPLVLPFGQLVAGALFLGHHHAAEGPVIMRQHQIIAACLFAAGIALGAARLLPALAVLGNAWPWLLAILAYVYVTYTEQDSSMVM